MKTDRPPLELLVPHKEEWLEAIDRAIEQIQDALGDRDL